tara:strand:- start:78 stop:290 length:213 start_codon:yes stop_codon:yes gene_type:complete
MKKQLTRAEKNYLHETIFGLYGTTATLYAQKDDKVAEQGEFLKDLTTPEGTKVKVYAIHETKQGVLIKIQ